MKTSQFSTAMHASAVVGGTRLVRRVLVLALIWHTADGGADCLRQQGQRQDL